uniref:DUF4776 domain-containing protein n=1 Tax=Anopheles minimus TaxID=112268 RepID=A0A182VX62_9DIPT
MVFSVEPSETSWESPGNPFPDQPARAESYSLIFFIKLLELNNRNEDEQYSLSVRCVDGGDSVTGTLTELNAKKPGDVVSLQADKETFIRFLKENSINVRIKLNDSTVYKGALKINASRVMEFDSTAQNELPVEERFPVLDENNEVVGMIAMVLNAVHNPPVANPDIIYRINDHKLKSADKQEAELRQLLVCPECSLPRSSNKSGCEYAIIDGILHRKGVSSTEKIIEQIKEKINRVKLDEAIGEPDSISNNGGEVNCKFCAECGGMTVTGETCKSAAGRSRSLRKIPETRHTAATNPTKRRSKLWNRCCERCKACLDWIPTECCCPKCGYKTQKEASLAKCVLPPYFNDLSELEPSPNEKTPSVHGSNTIIASSQSCQLCHICQIRCVDCANQLSQKRTSKTSSSFSCHPSVHDPPNVHSLPGTRPVTRRPWRTGRPSYGPKTTPRNLGTAKGKRTEEMQQVYGGEKNTNSKNQTLATADGKGRPSTGQIRKNYNAHIRKIKRQNRKIYSYRFGKRHPGIVVGHRTCMRQDPLVPPHMGWQWDICPPGIDKRRPGWRPGAVRQPIKQIMQHFLKCYPLDNIPVSKRKSVGFHTDDSAQGDHKQKPTLHITKQHGVYSIKMNPLKDSDTLKTTDDPYLPCKPIKFKLVKDPQRTKLYQLRDVLKRKSLPLCGCKDLANCDHCTEREKRLLTEEIRRSAKVLGLSAKTSIGDVPSDSESELDVEFTPPSAIIRSDVQKPDVVVAETQYNVQDFQLKPVSDGKEVKPKATVKNKASSGRVSNHGRGDATSKTATAAGSKNVNKKGDPGKKPGASGPDASNPKVRISVAKAKAPGGGAVKGTETTGKGTKK